MKKDFANQSCNLLDNFVKEDGDGTPFLTSMTLWESYEQHKKDERKGVKCKKKDVMRLSSAVFRAKKEEMKKAFIEAADFLVHQGIYSPGNLPYFTQFVPLAAIFAYDNSHKKVLATSLTNRSKLAQWYWCGVLGQLYASANETRYALDIRNFFDWVEDDAAVPNTVSSSNFRSSQLLNLKTRNSAAYKGIMALILKESPKDFAKAEDMSVATFSAENTDIHHIFPATYCQNEGLPSGKWDSIVNKTMISASTNRSIGGVAPSKYIKKLLSGKGNADAESIRNAIRSHQIDFDLLNGDMFDDFIIDRAKRLLSLIEKATGKEVSDRNSQQTIAAFGSSL